MITVVNIFASIMQNMISREIYEMILGSDCWEWPTLERKFVVIPSDPKYWPRQIVRFRW
jgi:hypothetical protein